MSATTHPPPPVKPEDDPVTAALNCSETLEKLRRQALALFRDVRKPRPDVRDVVQDTVARALNARGEFDPARGTVGGWLYGILANVAKEAVRKAQGQPTQPPDDSGWWDRFAPSRCAADADLADTRFLIERYLGKLAPTHQAVVKMRDFEDREYADIAAALNVTPVCARKLHSRAVLELKQLAAKEGRS